MQAFTLNLIKKRLKNSYFPVNIAKLKEQLFLKNIRWLLLNGKWKKLKRANLSVQKQPLEMLYKKAVLKLAEMG